MPNFEKCVKHEGKTYCWNPETKKVSRIAVEDIDFDKCPEKVLADLMSLLDSSGNKGE